MAGLEYNFIPSMDFTEKKVPLYFNQRHKRFARKTSFRFESSIDSRRSSKQSIPDNHYLRTPKGRHMNFNNYIQQGDFFVQLAARIKSTSTNEQTETTPLNQSRVSKDNYIAKLETLEAEKEIRDQEVQLAKQEAESLRKCLQEEKQRRRQIQLEKRELNKQFQKVKKQAEEIELQKKRIETERQYLIKQIEFLQKISFDEKTRTLQSYRQKYMEVEIQKLRKEVKMSKTARQKRLEEVVGSLKEEKYTLESHFKAVKISNQCLLKQLAHSNEDNKDIVLNSEEYIRLREKYKKFLDDYKHLRTEYWSLKNQVHVGNHQSSLLSVTFSSADESHGLRNLE